MHISVRMFSQGPNAPMFGAQRLVGPLGFLCERISYPLRGFLLTASGQSTVPHAVVVESRSSYTYSRAQLSILRCPQSTSEVTDTEVSETIAWETVLPRGMWRYATARLSQCGYSVVTEHLSRTRFPTSDTPGADIQLMI